MSPHTLCPLILHVPSYPMSPHTPCPLIPYVPSYPMSSHTLCPLIPHAPSYPMSPHTPCPLIPHVPSYPMFPHTLCPLIPYVPSYPMSPHTPVSPHRRIQTSSIKWKAKSAFQTKITKISYETWSLNWESLTSPTRLVLHVSVKAYSHYE